MSEVLTNSSGSNSADSNASSPDVVIAADANLLDSPVEAA